jgi:tRNA (adenine37-N6)-methyltransferase
MRIELHEIGRMSTQNGFEIRLAPRYAPGLDGMKGFSHILVVWYADQAPAWDDAHLTQKKPYRLAPNRLGIFTTRSPFRPNSVCVSLAAISSLDEEQGIIGLEWIDLEDGTPIIDIKPYFPSSDRIRDVHLPKWCSHWPSCYEESGSFPWDEEFLF